MVADAVPYPFLLFTRMCLSSETGNQMVGPAVPDPDPCDTCRSCIPQVVATLRLSHSRDLCSAVALFFACNCRSTPTGTLVPKKGLMYAKLSVLQYVENVEKKVFWCLYWLGLGVLSSIGLGSGLHTFVLYLGPHIAAVTLAAHECGSLNFPEPPYPDEIICPPGGDGGDTISLLSIMAKVRLESFMWGAGTALGELPPYFLARARSLSLSEDPVEEEGDDDSQVGRVIQKIIEKAGFFGILACASIPNPLFDLAGITCGHFLVPFWTFFGATLIGKAVIKMMLQKTFVILAFNEQYVLKLISILRYSPLSACPHIHIQSSTMTFHTQDGSGPWRENKSCCSFRSHATESISASECR